MGTHRLEDTGQLLDAWRDGRSRRRLKRQLFSVGFFVTNIAVVVGVSAFVWFSQHRSVQTPAILDLSEHSDLAAGRPLDQISSADIAVNLARLGRFEEVYWVAEQATAVEYLAEIQQTSEAVAEKPQVVNSTIRTRKDIITYVAIDGDTVDSVAAKFAVSSDSVKWSNGLTGNEIEAGKELILPPVGLNGIVYKVNEGDNLDDLAKKYQVSKENLISFNDVESGQLPVGEHIFMQDATQPVVRRAVVRNTTAFSRPLNNGSIAPGYTPLYGANGYVYGHCTYYVATRVSVPNGLGNANTWDDRASSFGYTKSKSPTVGSIAQSDYWSFYGHVAVVEEVNEDGSMIKYSDMNGVGGWGRVYRSDWVSSSTFNWYLH